MWSGIRRRVDKAWFNFRCAAVYGTPAVVCDPASPVEIVSQLYHPDTTMYVMAAKSLARFVRPRQFVIVDDGLTAADRARLAQQLGRVEFVPSAEVATGTLPRRGTWERLVTLAQRNVHSYVIQLDADTLTLGEPHEVQECIRTGRSFTLGTHSGRLLLPLAEASRFATERPSDHVQNHAERALGQPDFAAGLKYVRGCSAFTGFEKGQLEMNRLVEFSTTMERLIGRARWSEWGTEQVSSNFMAANARDALVLPVETYPFWAPDVEIESARLVHFFGTFRFSGGMYVRQAARLCRDQFA